MRHFGKYLLAHPEMVQLCLAKSRFISAVRAFLDNHGAVELQMPNLHRFREGAPVHQFTTTHPTTGERFYLRHCMEDHLRRATTVFERVYDIGKAFRVEDEDRSRAIEFLVLEFVGRGIKYQDGVAMVCQMISQAVQKAFSSEYALFVDLRSIEFVSFRAVFKSILGFEISDPALETKARAALDSVKAPVLRQQCYEWEIFEELMKHIVEPRLINPTAITDFPKSLQHVCSIDASTGYATRFSIIANGIEICDGGVKFEAPEDYQRVYNENAQYRATHLGITDNEEPVEFYTDISLQREPVFTFGLGVDRCLAVSANKTVHEITLFPFH